MLILDDQQTWPKWLADTLGRADVVDLLRRRTFIEDVVHDPTIRPILSAVEEYAAQTPLAVYHCTKQLPGRPFNESGLRVLNFQQHHAELRDLLRNHPSMSAEMFARIDRGLAEWQKDHTGRRERMIWFFVDRPLVLDSGAELFFRYFGGEAVYFGFMKDKEVLSLLESLGEPVVVEARIPGKDLTTFQEYAIGRTVVSYFARSVHPRFRIEHREGYVKQPVPPGDIVTVHPLKQFTKAVKASRKRHPR